MILTVEHTSGGRRCHCCESLQELVTEKPLLGKPINLKQSYRCGTHSRLRLCASCARRLFDDLRRALDIREDYSPPNEQAAGYLDALERGDCEHL